MAWWNWRVPGKQKIANQRTLRCELFATGSGEAAAKIKPAWGAVIRENFWSTLLLVVADCHLLSAVPKANSSIKDLSFGDHMTEVMSNTGVLHQFSRGE